MSAVVASDRIYDTFRSDAETDRTFYHGHTSPGAGTLSMASPGYRGKGDGANATNIRRLPHRIVGNDKGQDRVYLQLRTFIIL